jgi:hypothetical protein
VNHLFFWASVLTRETDIVIFDDGAGMASLEGRLISAQLAGMPGALGPSFDAAAEDDLDDVDTEIVKLLEAEDGSDGQVEDDN